MTKRWRYCVVTAVLAAVLTGCGDGTEGDSFMKSLDEVVDPVILTDESGSEEGENTPVPDATEDPGAKAGLQSSAGDLAPEVEAAVLESLKNLLQNMELSDYIGEAIHLVSSEEWFETVAAGLYEGCRSYTIGGAGEASLSVQVGYDVEEKPYINAWYQKDGQIILLKEAGGVVRLLQTSLSGGVYNGTFEKWRIDGPAGHILKETGTYVNGVVVGEYTKSEYKGGAGEAFDLWTNRENFEYENTSVTYNEKGEIAATPEPQATAQPTAKPTTKPTSKPTAQPTPEPPQNTPEPPQDTPEPPQDTPEPPQDTPEPPEPTLEPPQNTPEPPQSTPEPPQPTPEPPQATPEPPQPTPEPPSGPSEGDTDQDWSPDIM